MVGEKLIKIMVRRITIANLAAPEASGAIGSHDHATHATATVPAIATPSQPIEVQRQARDERDERRGHSGNDLELRGHRLGDDVSEVGAGHQSEQQVTGEARQVHTAQQVPDD
jgi:hypothetical protein